MRHGKAQLDKVPPLCLRMAASFRRLATGECFASLSDEFRIGASTLHKFDKQFLKWFRMTYWEQYVVGKSGMQNRLCHVAIAQEYLRSAGTIQRTTASAL
jgi:hypothetical protein